MVPCFVNVYQRYSTTIKLCQQIADIGAKPIIIDNASDWGPLLDWYDRCPYRVIRLAENLGHHAPWLCGAVSESAEPYYIVTDCDLDLEGVPEDCIDRLKEPFTWNAGIVKSGLSLRIDDLPEWQTTVKEWERRWWRRQIRPGWYEAKLDTTFALYQSSTPHRLAMQVVQAKAVRSAPPYTARHVPWYLDGDNLDSENQHYFATANGSNSWRPNGRGLTASYAR